MDSRFRSLHPRTPELRGHGKGSGAGDGEPGASGVSEGMEKPPLKAEDVTRSEKK